MPLRAPTPDEVESLRQQGVDVDRLPDKLQFGDDDSQMSVGRAALSTLSAHKGGILGGGIGAIGTGAALAGLGLAPFTAGLSLPISLLGLGAVGVGAAGAGYLGQKSQEALEGEEKTKQLQLEAARAASQHPIVSAATDITAGALASGGWPSPTTPIRAGVGAVRGLLGRGISAAEKSALQNVAIQGAINPAINVGISAATTGQLPSLGEVGQQALGGALFAGHGPLSRIGGRPTEPVGETHAKDNPTVTEEVPTPVRSSIFTQTDVNGLPLLDDTAVQHAFKQANPKPDTTNLGKVEAYAAETQWRNKNRLSVEEKRDMLHTAFLEQQDKQAAITPTETKPEPTPEVLATQPVVNDPKLTDFLKARQEVATQNVVPPPILTHENKQPPEIVQPNVPVGKPITANQARIINPDTLLQPDINRPQTPLSDETATETGVDKNKYYPSSKGEMDQYSKQKEILQTKLDNVNKILEDHSKVTQNLMDQQSSPERNKSLETANATLGSLQKTQSDLQQRLVNVEQAFNESNKPLRFIGEKGTREGDQILVTRDPVTEKWRTTYFGKPTSLEKRMNIGQMVPLGHEVHESKSEAIKWATGGEYAKHKFTEIPYDSPEAAFAPPKNDREPFTTEAQWMVNNPDKSGVTVSKYGSINGKQFVNLLKNKLSSSEYAVWKDAGIEEKFGNRNVNQKEMSDWLNENGPKVEVRKFGQNPKRQYSYSEFNNHIHELETKGYSLGNPNDNYVLKTPSGKEIRGDDVDNLEKFNLSEQELKDVSKYLDLNDQRNHTENLEGAHWSSIAPKAEKDMPGYVEIAVVKPPKKMPIGDYKNLPRAEQDKYYKESQDKFPSSHSFPPNTLAFARGYMETMPDGKKVFHVIEVQSDWAKHVKDMEEHTGVMDAEFNRPKYSKTHGDLLLQHYERLALKAVIDHAKAEGADSIAISDAETAMMTEGHDRNVGFSVTDETGKKEVSDFDTRAEAETYVGLRQKDYPFRLVIKDNIPKQAEGMRLHYDRTLPKIAEELTGDKGQRVEFGTHKMVSDNTPHLFNTREEAQQYVNEHQGLSVISDKGHGGWLATTARKDLIFHNADNTPKTSISARQYSLDSVKSKLDKRSFSMFNKYAPPSDFTRYNELQNIIGHHILSKTYDSPELHRAFAESESIKNRNKEMPPKAETQLTVGSIIENAKGSPKVDDHVNLISELKIDKEAADVPVIVSKELTTDINQRSRYDIMHDRIILKPEDAGDPSIVAHEILHAAIYKKLPSEFNGVRGYKLEHQMDKYLQSGKDENVKELIRSYRETAKQLGIYNELFGTVEAGKVVSKGLAGLPDRAAKKLIHGYAMGDLHEFVSEAVSNPLFQNHLNELPSGLKEGGTMWSRFTDAIRRILGVGVKHNSMLERVLRPIDELAQQERSGKVSEQIQNAYAPPKKTRGIEETRKGGFVGGAFRATIDKIRDIPHPAAGDVANAFHNVLVGRQEYIGKQLNPILQKGNGLTKVQDDRLALAARYEVENKKSGEFLLRTDKEKAVFRQEKASLKANFEERLKNEEPVLRNGRPTMPVRDEFYHPTTPNPKVVQVYRNGTDTAEIGRLDKVFVDYQKRLGLKPTEIKENLATWKQGVQRSANDSNSMGNQQFFNAARRAQGVPLPPEFTRPGFMKNVEAYFHRQATDNAYYKYVEDNPKVMSALGESMDAWRRPIDQHPQGSIAGNPAVRAQLNEIKGEVGGAGYHNEKAISSLATTLFIGPGTTIHKALSNFVGLTNYADNPYQLGKMLGSIVTNASKGLEHATENGVVKLTARSLKDLWAGNITGAERLQALAHTVRGIYSLGDLTDRWGAGLMQAGLEGVLPNKITQANKGDVTNQQLLRRIDPSYNIGKIYTDEGISKLASALVGSIHGTGDGRTMPPWMTGDSELSGFFKLSNWGISQTNRFMSDIYTPAMRGDVQPLLTGLFGAAVGGYLIKELREKLQGKRGQIPSLSEIANSSQGLEGNKGLLAYNLMASLSYAGFGGMLTTIGKIPIDWAYKNNAQGAVFPLDEISTDLAHTLGQVSTAIANDPNINWLHLTEQVAQHFLTTNIQLGRVAYNQMVDNGLITGSLAEKKALSDKLGQLRRFDIVEGLPYDEQDQQGNPYINIEQKRFKQTQDVGEAMKELPQLITNIMDKYHDKPDIMLEKIKALKQNTYATFPSMESTPISFMKYIGFLNREEGPDKAHDALVDYMRHKMINEAKASVVP